MKILIFLTLASIYIQCAISQELSCVFSENTQFGYSCNLHIQNPDGFDNFTHIGGEHLLGRSDSDVLLIRPFNFNHFSTIFPSILCQQFLNTQIIHLDFFGLERIADEAFRNCRNLTELQSMSNSLAEISENAFAENRNLQIINFFNNAIGMLSRNVFANQQSLLRLDLGRNRIESLPDGIFDSLTSLQTLHLDSNQLTTLPNEIFKQLRNIEVISIIGNQLTTLHSSWFENLQSLIFIDLMINQITSLPPNMFSTLSNLRSLSLARNNLTTIHSNAFGLLPNLFEFEMINNQINSIDERLIDNTGINFIWTGENPCDTTSGFIVDTTPNRELIRAAWQQCFDNFDKNECEVGNLDERVCRLEEEVRELRELIREFINERN